MAWRVHSGVICPLKLLQIDQVVVTNTSNYFKRHNVDQKRQKRRSNQLLKLVEAIRKKNVNVVGQLEFATLLHFTGLPTQATT